MFLFVCSFVIKKIRRYLLTNFVLSYRLEVDQSFYTIHNRTSLDRNALSIEVHHTNLFDQYVRMFDV